MGASKGPPPHYRIILFPIIPAERKKHKGKSQSFLTLLICSVGAIGFMRSEDLDNGVRTPADAIIAMQNRQSLNTPPKPDLPTQEYVREHGYPVNESGETYGPNIGIGGLNVEETRTICRNHYRVMYLEDGKTPIGLFPMSCQACGFNMDGAQASAFRVTESS